MRASFFFAKAIFAVLIGSCGYCSVSVAQETPDACAQIEDDKNRLECFDLLFRKSRVDKATTSAWRVKEDTSKIDDSTNVFVAVDSTEEIGNRFGQRGFASLVLVCRENETNVYFYFAGEHMASIQGYGDVTFRIDKQKAKTRHFEESTDNEALGLWSGSAAIPFIKELFTGNSLYVRATPFSESSLQVEFPIAGADAATKSLRSACKW
ncbi:type VI secretion system-associated protein TagO [Dongia sp.]|uniref:type VI secretion system-associated protein TagO n=1 Tax=Dongia sp. TaxID=1977262 RepID=UPI0035B23D37